MTIDRSPLTVALGSTREAKIAAVRAALGRIATVDDRWRDANVLARAVEPDAPAMPLTDEELMRGARSRAIAVQRTLADDADGEARFYVGLEGGFHSLTIDGERQTFLRGWAYVTDGVRGAYGASPSVSVPARIVQRVVEEGRELGVVIDEVAGERDVRSRQGAWGVFSRDLLTRSMSFEAALIAAFAPFYQDKLYL